MRLAILSDYQNVALTFADWSDVARQTTIDVFTEPFQNQQQMIQSLKDYEIICAMRERVAFPRSVFEQLPNLKFLATTGEVNFSIDLSAAADYGVIVSGTDNGSGYAATAELAWGLILDLTRNITREHNALLQGKWQTTIGRDLRGLTLGVLGLGNIGRTVAGYGYAFGMNVLSWSKHMTQQQAAEAGATLVPLETLMAEADVISIHLILSDRTRNLIDDRMLGRMKPSAILINTSRGPIVQETALIEALQERRIAGAGLDVFEHEPIALDHPYRSLDNVLLTPHLGYVTEETYNLFFPQIVENVAAFLAGAPIRLCTNDLSHPFLQ
ncbi:D-2-hydroxyacid dehydrogenase family protein [Propylenella binzhouense]|uniref:D-2-hydroxyacid dehydrogenase family protein n=1 Tax=Propylenella binzhouense TaxID=2555902 RepID=A0A964WS83_9HYPH|nr:D-2-hydroxyacid dehydrogenase family protein [Propylenella binzhouense]MYZ46565.1 D-2-hydroxyacid dehydrogenase family protein [Propylenella binzhouense]